MVGIGPIELLVFVLLVAVVAPSVLYVVVRLGVRHGRQDAVARQQRAPH